MREQIIHLRQLCRLTLLHPRWALMEGSGRLRTYFAPRHGLRIGRVGPIQFEYDFELSPMMRRMYARAYETEIVDLLRKLLLPGQVFVDVGANIGYLSSIAAGRVGPAGTVLSFEPAPPYFARLAAVRDANPAYRWKVYAIGLGAETSSGEMTLSSRNIGWNTVVPNQIPDNLAAKKHTISIRRLDDCLGQAGVEQVHVLKIDVEGYEGNVLRGCEGFLNAGRIQNIIVEALPGQYPALGLDFEHVMNSVVRCGYEARETRPPYRRIQFDEVKDGENIWFQRNSI